MNYVAFPGLGIELNISKVMFSVFGIDIKWYAFLIVASFIIAIIIYKIKDGLYDIKFDKILELCIYVIPIAFLSARAYYVLFRLDYFAARPAQILNIRQGGLAIYGGIIGGALTCYVFANRKNICFADLLDYIVPALALRTSYRQMG